MLAPAAWRSTGTVRFRETVVLNRDDIVWVMVEALPPVLKLFEETGAYLKGHFRLTSGMHSAEYLQSALVLQFPDHAERLGRLLAASLRDLSAGEPVAAVMAPALGGLIIGHEVARAMGARFLFTERDASGKMALRRGFTLTPGENVVVVEDVVTTGGSLGEAIEIARGAGANVLAAGSVIDRSGGAADLGVPRVALHTMRVQAYPPAECPLCREGIPAVKPGSRAA